MIVVDAAALVDVLVGRAAEPLTLRLAAELHCPHLVDVEVAQALRHLALAGKVTSERVAQAHRDHLDLEITRYGHLGLLQRTWELHENLSTYDAVYVALAESLDVPLVTADGRLAAAPGLRTPVEVYGPG